ncbi:hypothetical protein FO440_22590 [Mucilaginibacter corticis]|uniref:RNA polymerase sigma-70 region 2 domain-containing protein n=1 Tax=Mucilaginibacter corticis TaxID=2597670 RepID=A0A556M9W5_9SPHI|nr:hypothetical protein [Mucilaginibacter corticis]TSJ36618.1 hypothetical protein FO440_22590 [Mucilaginibacter corticis]
MRKPLTEAQLIREIKKRSEKGFSVLYDLYAPLLYKIIWLSVKDKELADRLLEDTFLAIGYQINEFPFQHKGFKLWMAGIAKRMALQHVKQPLSDTVQVDLPDFPLPDFQFEF